MLAHSERKDCPGQMWWPNSVWQSRNTYISIQHRISSGLVMCRATLVSCTVTAAETAAPGYYRKLQEATGSLSALGWGVGSRQHLLLTEDRTLHVFTSASQHSTKVVRFRTARCWSGNKDTKMIRKVAIFNKKVTRLPTLTLAVFTAGQGLLTCRTAAAERQLIWKDLPIPVTAIHRFHHHRTRNLPIVPHTLT